jgi:hypothetical protein
VIRRLASASLYAASALLDGVLIVCEHCIPRFDGSRIDKRVAMVCIHIDVLARRINPPRRSS